MPREKSSVSREDYLKAIWEMVQERRPPISARLADELGVTPPAVTAALKRLTRDGLLRIERGGAIVLTARGRAEAARLALRHQLEIENGFVCREMISAFDVNRDSAGLQGEIRHLATIVFERVANLVIDIDRIRGRLAAFEEDEVLGVNLAVAGDVHAI